MSTAREASGWTTFLSFPDLSFQARLATYNRGFWDLESTNGRPGGLEVDTTREMAKLTPTSALWLIGHSAGRDGWGDVEYLAAKGECVSWMTAGRLEGIPTRSI